MNPCNVNKLLEKNLLGDNSNSIFPSSSCINISMNSNAHIEIKLQDQVLQSTKDASKYRVLLLNKHNVEGKIYIYIYIYIYNIKYF